MLRWMAVELRRQRLRLVWCRLYARVLVILIEHLLVAFYRRLHEGAS